MIWTVISDVLKRLLQCRLSDIFCNFFERLEQIESIVLYNIYKLFFQSYFFQMSCLKNLSNTCEKGTAPCRVNCYRLIIASTYPFKIILYQARLHCKTTHENVNKGYLV